MRKNTFRKIYDSTDFQNARYKKTDFPFLIDIELTNYCNLKCLFCFAAQAMTRPKGFMEEKVFKKIIDECALYGTAIRFIRWGEPFLHPKIIKFVKYVKSKRLLLHITNNGLIITKRQMEALVKMELDSMVFSMQGATKEEYQRMRNNQRYDDLEKNIKEMAKIRGKKEKPFLQITSTMIDDKEEDIENFKKYWGKIVDEVKIGKTKTFWMPARLTKVFKKDYVPCTEVHQKMSVDWDGKITACCGDYDNFLTIGDVNESGLKEIWEGETLKHIRGLLDKKMHRSLTLCKTCEHSYHDI